jgi:hypothetical protein
VAFKENSMTDNLGRLESAEEYHESITPNTPRRSGTAILILTDCYGGCDGG